MGGQYHSNHHSKEKNLNPALVEARAGSDKVAVTVERIAPLRRNLGFYTGALEKMA